ncbi:PilZ domain-containing protein [Pontibacter sp. JAM-7]|uniref:PilZ domain-containing protein n=1 Tax=Pontibacter sp. JAM-7 TaxID=3366581 RepID=UPI003AF8F6B9
MSEQDRRQYFRINQKVALELKSTNEDDTHMPPLPRQFDVSPNFLLLSELQEMDTESQLLLRRITEKDSQLGSFMASIHKKIEKLAQAIASNEMTISPTAIQEVSLSEGGLQFNTPTPYPDEGYLSIKLVFPESCLGLLLYAQCLRCRPNEEGSYTIAAEFVRLPENCRTLLARQILESQARERQKANLQLSDTSEN